MAYRSDLNKWRKCENGSWSDMGGTGGVSDGDKGDITVSGGGATWEIDAGTVGTTELSVDPILESELGSLADLDTQIGTTGTADATTFLRGDNSWVTPSTGAPTNASYVLVGINGTLTDDRVLSVGAGLDLTDGGANNTIDIDLDATEGDFLRTGTVSPCGVGSEGALSVINGGPLNYCDGAPITPNHRYAAYADSSGNAERGPPHRSRGWYVGPALDRYRDLVRAHVDPNAPPPVHRLLRVRLLPGSPTVYQRLPVLRMEALWPRIHLGMGVEGGRPI